MNNGMKKYKIGYTQGVYDLFHIGHLNLLNNAKKFCDKLIVGVNSDDLVFLYKNKKPIINELDRCYIVNNVKAVDNAFVVSTLDKSIILEEVGFDAIFIGDDWKNNERWLNTAEEMRKKGIDVVFLPHTDGVSSTMLRSELSYK